MAARLEFEKPVIELQTKIAELKKFTQDSEMDLSAEIARLEDRLSKLQDEIYKNLKPWDRVQIARLPDRPTTLDYIQYLFTDFLSATETERTETMRRLSAESPNITACRSPSSVISAEKTRKKTSSAISECLTLRATAKRFVS
ncbi:Acetyl-CoA carboxylase [Bacillus velezensis]|nr:Acetyl-CoA carboxylase [Bacillus velezensis]